jgi:hypothetical protein
VANGNPEEKTRVTRGVSRVWPGFQRISQTLAYNYQLRLWVVKKVSASVIQSNRTSASLSLMIDLWILFSTIAFLCVYGAYQILSFVIRPYFSSLRDIPGPPNPSFFSGNSKEISDAPVCEAQERWIAEYGDTICWKADLNVWFLSACSDSSAE